MNPNVETPVLTYDPHPRAPTLHLPPLACDAHVHVFGPAARFAYSAQRNFTPVDAPREALFALHRTLGIRRCVIVQSLVHGFDNRVVEDAIAAGEGRYLGVALAPANVADAELRRLAAAGIRAVRFNFMKHLAGGVDVESVVALTPRLRAAGLHLQVHFASELIHELGAPLSRSAVPVVIDHMARVNARLGPDHADFRALLTLMRNPLFRVKLSGIDRVDSDPSAAPDYSHGVALARRLVDEFPERCLWGTDWPHVQLKVPMPNDGVLLDQLATWVPDAQTRRAILVDNPARLYGF